MAIDLTGSKYATANIDSVSTSTVSVSTSPFVSGDFVNKQRIVALFSPGGTLKGIGYVRRFISSSQLELERPIYQLSDNQEVTQSTGDILLVSIGWDELIAQHTNITGVDSQVIVDDTLRWGTAGDATSIIFYDEFKSVLFENQGAAVDYNNYRGGLIVQGHLQDPNSKSVYGGCAWDMSSPFNICTFGVATSTAAHFVMYGGRQGSVHPNRRFSSIGCFSNRVTSTEYGVFKLLKTDIFGTDVISINVGGNFTRPNDHIIDQCAFVSNTQDSMLVRWGNGINTGSSYKIANFSAQPIAVFGADIAGTFSAGASAGDRSIIQDIGNNNTLWRAGGNVVQTINLQNVVSSDYRAGFSTSPESSPGTAMTVNLFFANKYTNLQLNTVAAVMRDSDWSVEDSGTNASGDEIDLSLLRSTGVGHAQNAPRGPWTSRIRKYGFDEIENNVIESVFSLGTAGNAPDVQDGGIQNQVVRQSLSAITESAALAVAGITITDHGASPLNWQGLDWSITIEVDAAAGNSLLQVLAHIKAGIAGTADFNGRAGYLWHVLFDQVAGNYETFRGRSGGAGATLKGVRIINQAGDALAGVTRMQSDDGTYYVPPVTTVITINNLDQAAVYIEDDSQVQQAYEVSRTGTYVFQTEAVAGGAWKLVIDRPGYRRKVFNFVTDGVGRSFDGSLDQKLNFDQSPKYTNSDTTGIDINATDLRIDLMGGDYTGQMVFDAVEDKAATQSGIANDSIADIDFAVTAFGRELNLNVYAFRRDLAATSTPYVRQAVVRQNSDMPIDESQGQIGIDGANQLTVSGGGNTENEIHSYLDSYVNKGDWQADVSALATQVSVDAIPTDTLTTDQDYRLRALAASIGAVPSVSFFVPPGAGTVTFDGVTIATITGDCDTGHTITGH